MLQILYMKWKKEIVHLQNERKSVRVLQVINKTVRDHPVYKKNEGLKL